MNISDTLTPGIHWVANNPKKVAIGAISKGTIIGTGIAAYQTFSSHSKSTNTSGQSTDSINPPPSKADEFAKHLTVDVGLSLLGGTAIFGAAKAFSKYHTPGVAKTVADSTTKSLEARSKAV